MDRRRFGRGHPLIYWASERERIRLKRLGGHAQPWTDDPILQAYRFCNLRRRDDRVSQWLIRNVLCTDPPGVSRFSFMQFAALCRWVNWPPTIQAIIEAGFWPRLTLDLPAIGDFIDNLHAQGNKTWTGAYMIRAAPISRYGVIGKGRFVTEHVVGKGLDGVAIRLIVALQQQTCQEVWSVLQSAMNWGSFMAGQLVADWTYCSEELDFHPVDLYTWAPQGPGSRRGYNMLLGRDPNTRIPEDEWLEQLVIWRADLIRALGPEYDNLTLHDVQNALCELHKYLKVKRGLGRPRATYTPEIRF